MNILSPIPNYTSLRAIKPGYETRFQIDTGHPLHNDPLVDPREHPFFTDASSYYSKPNKMTGERLPGVPDAPLIRHDILRRIILAEEFLRSDRDVRDVFGAPLHLKIDDGLRPLEVQNFAYDIAWPAVIKRQNPHLTDEQVRAEVPNYCAKPNGLLVPTPHLTGGAVDVALINLKTDDPINRGHTGGKIKGTAYPDFHERYHLGREYSDIENSPEQAEVAKPSSEIVLGRRILHYAMTEVAGLSVNPQEIWHYGKGDPLSALVDGTGRPYYGIAKLPDWYTEQMKLMKP